MAEPTTKTTTSTAQAEPKFVMLQAVHGYMVDFSSSEDPRPTFDVDRITKCQMNGYLQLQVDDGKLKIVS